MKIVPEEEKEFIDAGFNIETGEGFRPVPNLRANAKPRAQTGAKLTQATAGAVIISEVEIAIDRWNAHNIELAKESKETPDLFKFKFDQFEYSPEAKAKSECFGYALLAIDLIQGTTVTSIYSKGANFKKENELRNTNGYFPNMAIDCIGFLLASGLMYNLALQQTNPLTKTDAEETKPVQPGDKKKSKPGTGRGRKPGKGDS